VGYINTVWEGTRLYKYCLGGYWVIQILSGRVVAYINTVWEGTGLCKYCLGGYWVI
jgi:hypothetical protein